MRRYRSLLTHYLIELKDRMFMKGDKSLSFVENINKNLNGKYSQKLCVHAIQPAKHTFITASKEQLQK